MAWFSILDTDWPALRDGFQQWLDPSNFDGAGRQAIGLQALMPRRKLASE